MITEKEKELLEECMRILEDKHNLDTEDTWNFIKVINHKLKKSDNDLKDYTRLWDAF